MRVRHLVLPKDGSVASGWTQRTSRRSLKPLVLFKDRWSADAEEMGGQRVPEDGGDGLATRSLMSKEEDEQTSFFS